MRVARIVDPLLVLAALALLAHTGDLEARGIRVDSGGGGWEQNFGNVLDAAGDTGEVHLPFSFLGSNTLFIGANGELSNGSDDSFLRPLRLGSAPDEFFISFDWGGSNRDCSADPLPAACGPDGARQNSDFPLTDQVAIDFNPSTVFAEDAFRVRWFSRDAEDAVSDFQVVVWRLANGDYVIELNYDELSWGLDGSSLGFLIRDPADAGGNPFEFARSDADYGVTFINLFNCIDFEGCAAGDNFVGEGFPPGALLDAFFDEMGDGTEISGRALFYLDAEAEVVPEPDTLALLLSGALAWLAVAGRGRGRA
jgi:hypothetical protein